MHTLKVYHTVERCTFYLLLIFKTSLRSQFVNRQFPIDHDGELIECNNLKTCLPAII